MAQVVIFVTVLGLNGLSRILGACPDSMVLAKGRCYGVMTEPVSSLEASHKCKQKCGDLASIPFYELLTTGTELEDLSLQNGYCYWIGQVYLSEYMETLEFSFWETLRIILNTINRCAVICRRGSDFPVEGIWCTEKRFYICEYEERPVHPKKPVRKPLGRVVVIRTPGSRLINGPPTFTTSASLSTMCSRICLKSDGCGIFNFNMVTHECRGFPLSASVNYKEQPRWELWVLKRE